jgi:peptidoglycan biosynthesis protein MviN/MurJ (putative lipid II flippase)
MVPRILQSFFSQERLAGGAIVLALTQLGASVAGLFRDRMLAATFPVGIDQLDLVSVYIASFRPADFLFQMFVMSAFSVALVPFLAAHLAQGRREEMDRLLTSTLIVSSCFFGAIALLLAFFFPALAHYFVAFTGESLDLYIQFGRLACLTNFLFVMGNAFGQYLITRQKYLGYGITPILYTLGTIGGTLWLTPLFGPYGPMYGTIAGAVVYVLVRFSSSRAHGFSFRLKNAPLLHPDIAAIGWLMLPRMAALGALQLQLLFFDAIASGLPLGSVTINAYARNFQAAAVGVVGVALAQSAYSLLSQAISRGEVGRFWMYLRKGTLLTLALTIPGALLLSVLAHVAARIVHLIEPSVIAIFVITLGIYCISIPFESLNHLLLRATYATKHTTVPAILSVLSGVIAIVVAWQYAPTYGVYALAMGFMLGQVVQMIGLLGFLRIRVRALHPLL